MERKVDMVRLERPEELYDVEEVLGRDATSVFPTRAKAEADKARQLTTESIQEMLGAKKFVTEKELDDIKASRGLSTDDGTAAPLKPLVEVLREAKEKKEQEFADKWKQMKTGKNRPLEQEELDFLDAVAEAEAARVREQAARERQELEDFKRATAELAAAEQAREKAEIESGFGKSGGGGVTGAPGGLGPAPRPQQPVPGAARLSKPVIRAVIKPKPKGGTETSNVAGVRKQPLVAGERGETAGDDAAAPDAKKPRTDAVDACSGEGEGLAGLLGGYGSGSDLDA